MIKAYGTFGSFSAEKYFFFKTTLDCANVLIFTQSEFRLAFLEVESREQTIFFKLSEIWLKLREVLYKME